jgi:phosphoglycolate phosphatase-like HAD superfamily hydrolase
VTDLADRLASIELVVFDKDGTLIDFHGMWAGWAIELAGALEATTGRSLRVALLTAYGVDPRTRRTLAHGLLAATPMARLREATVEIVARAGVDAPSAEQAVAGAWDPPDPVTTSEPLADLRTLLGRLRAGGRRIAIATTDDREPTMRTVGALGIGDLIDATVSADDGVAVKPAADMVLHLCALLGAPPVRTAVVGDSPSDLLMGRAAGAGLVVGVLSGVGRRRDLAPLADVVIESVAELAH